jgi:chorismate mutase
MSRAQRSLSSCPPSPPLTSPAPALARWRASIDQLDAQLVTLLARRTRLSVQVAHWKHRRGVPLETPSRERVILARAKQAARGPLTPAAAERIFRAILTEMRAVQSAEVGARGPRARGDAAQ